MNHITDTYWEFPINVWLALTSLPCIMRRFHGLVLGCSSLVCTKKKNLHSRFTAESKKFVKMSYVDLIGSVKKHFSKNRRFPLCFKIDLTLNSSPYRYCQLLNKILQWFYWKVNPLLLLTTGRVTIQTHFQTAIFQKR